VITVYLPRKIFLLAPAALRRTARPFQMRRQCVASVNFHSPWRNFNRDKSGRTIANSVRRVAQVKIRAWRQIYGHYFPSPASLVQTVSFWGQPTNGKFDKPMKRLLYPVRKCDIRCRSPLKKVRGSQSLAQKLCDYGYGLERMTLGLRSGFALKNRIGGTDWAERRN
jgi:hypothetical protein